GEQDVVGRERGRELRQLRGGRAEVAHPLEVQVGVQNREHESQIARNRRLPCEEHLDRLFRSQVDLVHVVVEGDDLVRELDITSDERVDRSAQRTQDEAGLFV